MTFDTTKRIEKYPLLDTSVNKNNRVYSIDVLDSICEQINQKRSDINLGTLGIPEGLEIKLRQVAFTYSNARVENDKLYVDIEILETNSGAELKQILEIGEEENKTLIAFRPFGAGTFEGEVPYETRNLLNIPNKISLDYKILGISAIPAKDDAYGTED